MKLNEKKVTSFKIIQINKKNINNMSLFYSIKDENNKIMDILKEAIDENDIIYAYKYDKQIKAIYIIKELPDKELKLIYSFISDDITIKAEEKIENIIIEEFIDSIVLGDYDKLIWNDKEISPKFITIGTYKITYGLIIMIACILIGILLRQILIGICVGICFAAANGVVVTSEKRSLKKRKKKNN